MPQNYDACFPASLPPTVYTDTGNTTAFPVGFPTLKQSDIVVFTGDNATATWTIVPTTDYSVNSQGANNAQQVVFNSAPGTDVLIMRQTDLCNLVITFQAGQSIRAQDLNNALNQQLYLTEEMYVFLREQFGGDLIPGGGGLDDNYWNKDGDTLEDGDVWVSDDAHIATTAAGDDRWLNPNNVAQTGGTWNNPEVNNTVNAFTVSGGAGITVTGDVNNNITIDAVAGGGGLTFRGTLTVAAPPAGGAVGTPLRARAADAWTITPQTLDANVDADWDTLLANWNRGDGNIDAGDVIVAIRDVGTPAEDSTIADAAGAFNRIASGGGFGTLQQVTTEGNSTTNNIELNQSDLVFEGASFSTTFDATEPTANQTISLPNASGTVALTDQNSLSTTPAGTGIRLANTDGSNDDVTLTAGNNITITRNSATELTIESTGGDVSVEDDGTEIVATASTLNFTGDGVTVTANGNTANVAITGGGGGDGGTTINYNGAAAWGTVAADGTLDGGLNCTVTNTGAGTYSVVFNNAMPNANYSVVATAENTGNKASYANRTALGFTVFVVNVTADTLVNGAFNFAVHSLNALPPKGTTGSDAWASINADGTTNSTYNCTVTSSAAGTYDVAFTTAMPNANYAINSSDASFGNNRYQNVTANGFTLVTLNGSSSAAIASDCSFSVFATNANLPFTVTQEQIEAAINSPGVSAWGSVNVSGTAIQSQNGLNCTTARTSEGVYTVTFDSPMPNGDYSVVATIDTVYGNGNWARDIFANTKTANGFVINIGSSSGENPLDYSFDFAVHALNAAPPKGGTGTDAWGTIAANAFTITNGFNCTAAQNGNSIEVTFTNPMPNANYAITYGGESFATTVSQTATGFIFNRLNSGGNVANTFDISFSVNATNANLPTTITEDQIAALIQNPTCSAWCKALSAGGTAGGFNVDSVVNNGNGIYTVTWVTPFPDTNYAIVASGNGAGTAHVTCTVRSQTATNCQIQLLNDGTNGAIAVDFYLAAFGTARNGTLGGGADAWATTASTAVMAGGFNLSVASGGAGIYSYTFTNPMPNVNYSVLLTPQDAIYASTRVYGKTVNGFNVLFQDITGATGTVVACNHNVAVFATDGNAGGFWQSTGVQGTNTQIISPLNNQATLTIDSGSINFNNLPTADPAVAGRLWNDSGTLRISAG